NADAACCSTQEQRCAETPALHRSVDGQPPQAKHGHIVTSETFFHDRRRAVVFDRCRAQRVKSENAFRLPGRRGNEAFRAANLVVLASVSLQLEIEFGGATVKGRTVMVPCKGALVPDHWRHLSLKPALAAR